MSYATLGPFNLEEGRALSAADPMECTEFEWGHMTYLEAAGSAALRLGGFERRNGCSSHHAGRALSTITYHDVPMVLCQIDYRQKSNFLNGVYICSEEIVTGFLRGMNTLIDEKMNPESDLNKVLNERRGELKKRIDSLPDFNPSVKERIVNSGILNPSNMYRDTLISLRERLIPNRMEEEEMIQSVQDFYYEGLPERNIHIGRALKRFDISIASLVEAAVKEDLELMKDFFSVYSDGDKKLKKYKRMLMKEPEKFLFG